MRRNELSAMLVQPAATDSPMATATETPPRASADSPATPAGDSHGIAPIGFTVLLLVLATTSQGAFAISRWAPLALFALALLIGVLVARGTFAVRSVAVRFALAGIWGLSAW